jgi:hypothetical protein
VTVVAGLAQQGGHPVGGAVLLVGQLGIVVDGVAEREQLLAVRGEGVGDARAGGRQVQRLDVECSHGKCNPSVSEKMQLRFHSLRRIRFRSVIPHETWNDRVHVARI